MKRGREATENEDSFADVARVLGSPCLSIAAIVNQCFSLCRGMRDGVGGKVCVCVWGGGGGS